MTGIVLLLPFYVTYYVRSMTKQIFLKRLYIYVSFQFVFQFVFFASFLSPQSIIREKDDDHPA